MLENERDERDRRAVADERLRIARDLHDIVSHAMSVIAVQAGTGHHLLDRDPEAARRALSNVETASRSALVEMRRMLGVLRDDDDAPGSRTPAPGLSKLGELIARVAHPDDGRAVVVQVTAAGRKLHQRVQALRSKALADRLERIPAAQAAELLAALPALEALAAR